MRTRNDVELAWKLWSRSMARVLPPSTWCRWPAGDGSEPARMAAHGSITTQLELCDRAVGSAILREAGLWYQLHDYCSSIVAIGLPVVGMGLRPRVADARAPSRRRRVRQWKCFP